jgi:hypothetical protein
MSAHIRPPSASSRSPVFPLPLIDESPVGGPSDNQNRSSSRRVRQRWAKVALRVRCINAVIRAINRIHPMSEYHRRSSCTTITYDNYQCILHQSASSSSTSVSSSSLSSTNKTHGAASIHTRILSHIDECVQSYLSDCRGDVSPHTGSSYDGVNTDKSFYLSNIVQTVNQILACPPTRVLKPSISHITPPSSTSSQPHSSTPSSQLPEASQASSEGPSAPCIDSPQSSGPAFYASSSSYFHGMPVAIERLCAHRVALPEKRTAGVDMIAALPHAWKRVYSSPDNGLLKEIGEGKRHLDKLSLPTPKVNGSMGEYIKLISRLVSVDMISFASPPPMVSSDASIASSSSTPSTPSSPSTPPSINNVVMCVNGLFTITKDALSTRLIIDARYANALFVDPPAVRLPTPANFIELTLRRNETLFKAKMDVANFYHEIVLPPWLSMYFALPPVRVSSLSPDIVSGDPLLRSLPSTAMVHPVLRRLAMGFSHSVAVAQAIHENLLYSCGALSPSSNILNVGRPVIGVEPIHALYVDDNNMLGSCPHALNKVYQDCASAYKRAGFPVKQSKCVPPTSDTVTMIGVAVHGTGRVAPTPERVKELLAITHQVIMAGCCTGRRMAAIVGSWTWVMLLRRFTLCIFRQVYRFTACAGDKEYTLWPSVVAELATVMGIAPMLRSQATCVFFPHVVATDASLAGAGMVASTITAGVLDDLYPVSGKHVDHESATSSSAVGRYCRRHPAVHGLLQPHISYNYMQEHARMSIENIKSTAYKRVDEMRWWEIVAYRWRHEDHINALEMSAVVTAIRWVSSHPSSINARLLLCTDNAAAYYALKKGRSGKLLPIIRRIASTVLATGISLSLIWLPSETNPADSASRRYVNDGHGVLASGSRATRASSSTITEM